ncbi:DEKNAAC104751 [Brettanomyces naardenensis]|uniref:DEKNAAC104751 n=1 Tax=Brettanomyces naardenensis TaxID=13370 RepID=A0A448YRH2_BRENA|nr:DEKNAAC104751 [Brettanomyces naardenensis]
MSSGTRKSTHEELLAASHAVEQELNVVKALKRLSLGNSFNYDPDLPPDEAEFVDLNYIDVHRSPTSRSTGSASTSSSSGSSVAVRHSTLWEEQATESVAERDEEEEEEEEEQEQEQDTKGEAANVRKGSVDSDAAVDDYDAENVILDSNKLMWVPATAHPKLAPDNFRKYVQETVQDITTKLDKSRSKRSSLSTESTDTQLGGQPGAGKEQSRSIKRNFNTRSKPSLKELTEELESLSHLAGMDSTDAVTLARTLSSSSLGFTEMEKELYSNSDPLARSSSLTAHQSSQHSLGKHGSSQLRISSAPVDESLPIPISEGNELKRARWTTYRKSGGPKLLRHGHRYQRAQEKKDLTERQLPRTPSSRLPPLPGKQNSELPPVPLKNSLTSEQLSSPPSTPEKFKYARTASEPVPEEIQPGSNSHESLSEEPLLIPTPKEVDDIENFSRSSAVSASKTLPLPSPSPPSVSAEAAGLSTSPSSFSKRSGWNWLKEKSIGRSKERVKERGDESGEEKSSRYFSSGHTRNRHGTASNLQPLRAGSSSSSSLSSESSGKDYVPSSPSSLPPSPPSPTPASSKEKKPSLSNIFRFRSRQYEKSSDEESLSLSASTRPLMELKAVFGNHHHHHEEESHAVSDKSRDPNLRQSDRRSDGISEERSYDTMPRNVRKSGDQDTELQKLSTGHYLQSQQKLSSDRHSQPDRPPLGHGPSETYRHRPGMNAFESQKQAPVVPLPSQPDEGDHEPQQQEQQQRKKYQLQMVQKQQREQEQQQQQKQKHHRHHQEEQKLQTDEQEGLAASPLAAASAGSTEALKQSLKVVHRNTKPNQPLEMRDSAFGFPLPPVSRSTLVMLDYRFPIHVERAVYRLSHLKLADPKRPLYQQVLLSNFMYAYLNLVNHTLYLQQQQDQMFPQQQQQQQNEQVTFDAIGGEKESLGGGFLMEESDQTEENDEFLSGDYDESRHIEEMYGSDVMDLN